ncbi:MAG: altronate dehydratase family protein [Cyclobacteriaceae bacterium]
MDKILQIDPKDNVLVALADLTVGEVSFRDKNYQIKEPIAQKHKFFTEDIPEGGIITMYGVPVGKALRKLHLGERMSTENITHFANPMNLEQRDPYPWDSVDVSKWKDRTFQGYHREDGQVGTANYWLFIPLVFCENRNLRIIEDTLKEVLGYKKPNNYLQFAENLLGEAGHSVNSEYRRVFENIDGIKFLYHDGGCGGTKADSEALLRILVSYLNHPNVAGATVLSLGCQHAQYHWFQEINKELFPKSERTILFFEQQQIKSEEKLIQSAIKDTIEVLEKVNKKYKRAPATLDKLTIGLECGGSDGFSGISANPTLGVLSDKIVSLGGATILSEFPELNGVEQNILNRCTTDQVAQRFFDIQKSYERKAHSVGSGFDMNPSPGNVKDGLITDAIKSAGAAKKGGTAPVSDVLDYGEHVTKAGLNLLCTPGNDVESTTGLAAAGANIILFTTGLGTPTGNPVTPVIKVSSNTKLAEAMPDIIDFNTGKIISGEQTLDESADELLEKVIAIASGEESKAMKLEQNDFIFWKRGVSL